MKIARKLVPTIPTMKMKAQQKHVLMFNKLSKPSTFSYKFSCKFEQYHYIQKPYTLPLNPSNPYTLQLTPLSTLPNTCVARYPQKPDLQKKR